MSIISVSGIIDMKKTTLILTFLAALTVSGLSQSTAVMQVKVKVIQGVKAEVPTNIVLSNVVSEKEANDIIITSAPNSDVTISTDPHLVLENQKGELVKIKTDSTQTSNYLKGIHKLSIKGESIADKNLNGNYKGSVTTVVNYL